MSDTMLALAISDAGIALEALPADATLEAKVRAAMERAARFWGTTDDDLRFRGALGAVLVSLAEGSADRLRLEAEIQNIRVLSAALSGVPVDFEAALGNLDDRPEPIGAVGIWREVNGR